MLPRQKQLLYNKLWALPQLRNLTMRQRHRHLNERYGKIQVAMLTLEEMQDFYDYLTSDNEYTKEDSTPVPSTPKRK